MTAGPREIHIQSSGCSSLLLEGCLHCPQRPGRSPAVVLAHPHPLWGGSMDSQVLVQLAITLTENGCTVLRFNFRGVGRSQGRYDHGNGEIDDLVGALDALADQDEVDPERLAVAGYSFGAWIGGQGAVRDDRVRAFVALALPMSTAYHLDMSRNSLPKLFLTGARDSVSCPELLRQYVGALPDPKTLRVIPGADHFLLGYEQEVADHVAGFLSAVL